MAAITRLMTFAAFLLLTVAPSLSTAAFTYTYTGDDYSSGTNGAFLTTPASPPRVSGSFTVSNLLLPNSTLNISNLVSYSFNNGLETIDQDNGVIYVFRVSTDAQGLISQTEIQVQKWDSLAAVGSYLDDIEIINLPNRINRTYYHVKCTQLQSNACSGLEFVTTGPNTSSYANWTSGTWQTPLQAIAGQNPLYVSSSTTLDVRGGNGSSGAVTYQLVSGPCTLSENLLTGTGTGDCIVTATQAADGSHPQETSAPTTITVIQAPPLVVTVEENPIQISGSTTLTTRGGNGSTGTVTYQLISGPCTLSENVITGTGLGDCVVTATQAGDSLHPQMTSAPATITVSLTPQSSLYVAANPSSIGPGQTTHLTTSGGSGMGVVSYQLINGPCTLNGSRLSGTSVGTCMVTATKAGDSSYAPITAPAISVGVSLTPQIWSAPPSNLSQPAYEFDPEDTQLTLSGDGTRAAAVWWIYDGTHAKVQFSSAIINGNVAEWIAPVDISPPGMDAGYPQIALSADGSKVIAIWTLYDGPSSVIQSAVASIDGSHVIWSNLTTLSASNLQSGVPQVALSADGAKATAIWQMYHGSHLVVQASSAIINGVTATWSSAANVSSPDTVNWNPQILLSEDGARSTAIWSHNGGANTIIQSSSSTLSGDTSTWGDIVNLSQLDSDAEQPSFSLSSDGTRALAIWQQSVGRNQVIKSSSATISGNTATWSSTVDVSPDSLSSDQPQVALSRDGSQGVAIWARNDGGYELIESATANLSVSPMIWSPAYSLPANGRDARNPQIKISDNGTRATAVWWEENHETFTVQSTSGTLDDNGISWGGAAGISQTDDISVYPKLALSGDGTRATAIWSVFSLINYSFYIQSSSATILYPALSPSSQSITGSIGVATPPMTPFNAQGLYGTISYTISPALPAGLTLNSATGVISGISYSALASTTYTITGTGSMGGTASAEVTLEIPEGPPLVTNLVATPAPGPSIILTFNLQTASISSWLKSNSAVTYTGTCTSSDGGVTATGTGPGSPISVPGVTAGKIYSCVVTGSDGSGSSTSPPSNAVVPIPPPPPNPIPTLSNSAKWILILLTLMIALWSRRRLMA